MCWNAVINLKGAKVIGYIEGMEIDLESEE